MSAVSAMAGWVGPGDLTANKKGDRAAVTEVPASTMKTASVGSPVMDGDAGLRNASAGGVAGAAVKGGEPTMDHLVVDAGALIRLENLHGVAHNYWTVREVLSEVRDSKARAALERLPFDLKPKEPSRQAIEAVVAFAKKTGDFSVLSKPDIKIMALAWMLHAETHGVSSIRTEPLKAGQDAATTDGEDINSDAGIESTVSQSGDSLPKPDVDIKTIGVQKPGVSWACALSGKIGDSGSSVANQAAESAHQRMIVPTDAETTSPAAENMWDDDDFAGVPGASESSKDNDKAEQTQEQEQEWPTLGQASDQSEKQHFLQVKEIVSKEVDSIENKIHKKIEKRNIKRAQTQAEKDRIAAEEKVRQEELLVAQAETAPKPNSSGSRLLGASGVTVADVEGDDDEDDIGWITASNIDSVDPTLSAKRMGLGLAEDAATVARSAAQDALVGCVTTDYAMQNVMIQMQLRLLTLEGRAVTSVRRFVLKCDSCKTICRVLDKRFCPDCGHPSLARLSYSISPDGLLRYHYKKNRKINTRGTRYSLPNPKGGRTGDLLLYEDQLLTGWWAQQAKKKNSSTSMFGEHVTESLGLKMESNFADLRIGYGRQNPNAAKGRERRGKKKKRSEKKPGYL